MNKKYFCSNCKGLRNHNKLHETVRKGDEDGWFQWIDKHLIIECLGCDTVSFLNIYGNTEMTHQIDDEGRYDYYNNETIYPYYLSKGSEIRNQTYLPKKIREIYVETVSAFKSNALILTAGGFRAIIEAICNNLKMKEGSLASRIDLLHKKGYLTLSESKRLHSIRFLGNDALHEIGKPKTEQLYLLLDIINHLLENLFINDKKIKDKVETLIDTYDEFILLVKRCINKKMINNEYTLKKILNKSIRLIPKANFKDYELKFINEIKKDEYSFINVVGTKPEAIYKINKVPSTFKFGIL